MRFKSAHMRAQYDQLPTLLHQICDDFEAISQSYGVDPVVTRVTDPVAGESGVHAARRAIDFRSAGPYGRLYSPEQIEEITAFLNLKYERSDGKLVCIHHSFGGGPEHFHLQVPLDPKVLTIHSELTAPAGENTQKEPEPSGS